MCADEGRQWRVRPIVGRRFGWWRCHLQQLARQRQVVLPIAVGQQLPAVDALRPQTYSTLISLLAATGLRISEALHLRYDDVTPDGLLIRKTKFQKSRLVPLHPT